MRSRRMTALALGLSVVITPTMLPSGLGSVAMAQDLGQSPGAVRLNAIIQDLKPAPRSARTPVYRRKVRRVTVPVRRRATATYTDVPVISRGYVLNYNHSVDLEIFYPFDSAAITPRAAEALDVLGRALTSPELRSAVYLLAGHTDARGPADYNQWLSEQRALAAKDYLVRNFPIDPDRLVPIGFGERELLDPDAPNAALNRRVEVTLIDTAEEAPQVGRVDPATAPVSEDRGTNIVVTDVAPVGDLTGNVVCDTSPVVLSDSRPALNDLDDFGGVRTPVECEDVHLRTPDATLPDVAPEAATSGDTNSFIND